MENLNKVGRPAKPADLKKQRHNLTFTEKEWDNLTVKAQKANLDRGAFIVKSLNL